MKKVLIALSVLAFLGVVFWPRSDQKKPQQTSKRAVQLPLQLKGTQSDKKLRSYASLKKLLVKKTEDSLPVIISGKDYRVSHKLRAVKRRDYHQDLGQLVAVKDNYAIYQRKSNQQSTEFAIEGMPVLYQEHKAGEHVFTGKLIVREHDEQHRQQLESLGFSFEQAVQSLGMSVYQVPSSFNLTDLNQAIQKLPQASWEMISAPVHLR